MANGTEEHSAADLQAEGWDRQRVAQSPVKRHAALAAGVSLVPAPPPASRRSATRASSALTRGISRRSPKMNILQKLSSRVLNAPRSCV